MTLKEIVVLIATLAGIYANLLFQDSLAAADPEAQMGQRLHAASTRWLEQESVWPGDDR